MTSPAVLSINILKMLVLRISFIRFINFLHILLVKTKVECFGISLGRWKQIFLLCFVTFY